MKKQKVKTKLNDLVNEIQINDIDENFIKNISYQPVPSFKPQKRLILIPSLAMSLVALIITFVIVINTISAPVSTPKPQEITLTEVKKKLAYQTIGCYSLIETASLYQPLNLSSGNLDEVKEEIENYLLLAKNYLEIAKVSIKLYESDRSNYTYMYNIITNRDSIWFYFNETTLVDTDDIDEVSSSINGILCMNNEEYEVRGEKEVEMEEIETTLMIRISSTTSIEVSQEIENRENEYEFTYYHNGQKTKTLEIEMEQEANHQCISINDINNLNSKEIKMEFKLYDDLIICDIEMEQYSGEVTITINNNNYSYHFDQEEKDKKILNFTNKNECLFV